MTAYFQKKIKYRLSPVKLSPLKTGILPPRTISRQGGTVSRESRRQPLLSLLHTKTATPYSTRNCPPLLPYEILSPTHFFPQGGQFHGGGSVVKKLSKFSALTPHRRIFNIDVDPFTFFPMCNFRFSKNQLILQVLALYLLWQDAYQKNSCTDNFSSGL